MSIWRDPPIETEDYPNLTVHDGRVSGSINVHHSRLPLWAVVGTAVGEGWESVERNWPQITAAYGFTRDDFAEFLYCLLEMRGEFGRLLCVLADVERRERKRDGGPPWWEHKRSRARVVAQLRRCLAALEASA